MWLFYIYQWLLEIPDCFQCLLQIVGVCLLRSGWASWRFAVTASDVTKLRLNCLSFKSTWSIALVHLTALCKSALTKETLFYFTLAQLIAINSDCWLSHVIDRSDCIILPFHWTYRWWLAIAGFPQPDIETCNLHSFLSCRFIEIEWLALLLRSWEVPGSDTTRKPASLTSILWYFYVPAGKSQDICWTTLRQGGRDSSVGIATRYGLDGPGIESRCGRDFPHPSRPAVGPTQPLYNGYRVFPGGKAAGAWCWTPTPT